MEIWPNEVCDTHTPWVGDSSHMSMWILSNISVSWYPLLLKGCVECFPKMQSLYLPPMVSSSVIFRLSTNVLTAISWIVSSAACPNLRCHVSKVAGRHFVCNTNAIGVLDMEIRLEWSSGVCSVSSKVIFLFVPLMHISILAFPFPVTLKMDSLVVARPMVSWCNGVSDMNDSLLTKQ